jgi:hypothetical protein
VFQCTLWVWNLQGSGFPSLEVGNHLLVRPHYEAHSEAMHSPAEVSELFIAEVEAYGCIMLVLALREPRSCFDQPMSGTMPCVWPSTL